MVKTVKGNLFEAPEQLLAHGVNCLGAFGAGVAAGMAHCHRKARDQYLSKFQHEGWNLGDVQFVRSGSKWIANCATQFTYGTNGCHVDYFAVEKCMKEVKKFARDNDMSVAIPRIGSGLAGGDWDKISSIIGEVFTDYDVTIYGI